MRSVRKITLCSKTKPAPLKRYTPKGRIEKIKYLQETFPESTDDKIIFVSNSQGNGFKEQNLE